MVSNQGKRALRRVLLPLLYLIISLSFTANLQADDNEKNTNKAATNNSEKHVFRYKFRENEILKWEVVSKIDQLTNKAGQRDETETRSVSTKIWKVIELKADGTAILEYSIADVDMRCSSSLAEVERTYNSKTDEKPPLEYLDVARLIGTPIAHFTINPQGEIIKRVQKADVAVTVQFSETAEENRITIPMPEHAIVIGDAWDYSREIVVPKSNGTVKRISVCERYTLEKIQNGVAYFDFKTIVLTPLYDDKDTEWDLRTKIRNGKIQFDMFEGRSISQQYDTKKTAINVQEFGRGSATYQSRFTEKCLSGNLEPVPSADETGREK
jgi:hypothetical protein